MGKDFVGRYMAAAERRLREVYSVMDPLLEEFAAQRGLALANMHSADARVIRRPGEDGVHYEIQITPDYSISNFAVYAYVWRDEPMASDRMDVAARSRHAELTLSGRWAFGTSPDGLVELLSMAYRAAFTGTGGA